MESSQSNTTTQFNKYEQTSVPMSKTESALQFSASSRTAELWKSVSSAIMTIVDEAHFEATPEGLKFRSMDPSHIALIDIDAPAAAFERYECPSSTIKFGVRVSEFAKVIRRASANDSIDVGIQDNWLVVKTLGGYARNYKMRLIETTGSTSPVPKLAFDSKLVMTPSILDRILSDVTVVSDKLTIETTATTKDKVVLFGGKGDTGEAKVTIDEKSGIENLNEISVGAPSKASYSAEFISKIVKAIGASSQLVTMEYSSNKPLKMAFALPNAVKIEFFMAPRVED
jgi:proliferating cell nuclear antigen